MFVVLLRLITICQYYINALLFICVGAVAEASDDL